METCTRQTVLHCRTQCFKSVADWCNKIQYDTIRCDNVYTVSQKLDPFLGAGSLQQ